MEIDIATITEQYIKEQEAVHEKLLCAAKSIGRFHENTFDFHSLKNEDLEVFRKKQVLYFFRIGNMKRGWAKEICQAIAKMKGDKNFKAKLPKVNIMNASLDDQDNDILYVGKSNGYFHTRLKQHLGNESPETYALHLKHWAPHKLLGLVELKIYWVEVDVAIHAESQQEQQAFLELLENGLHRELKPLLGRMGH